MSRFGKRVKAAFLTKSLSLFLIAEFIFGIPLNVYALEINLGPLSPPTLEELSPDSKIITEAKLPAESVITFPKISDVVINSGNIISLNLEASSSSGREINFEGVDLPEGANLEGSRFEWLVSQGTAGECQISFIASDGIGAAEQVVTFYLVPFTSGAGNRPPASRPVLTRGRDASGKATEEGWVVVIPSTSSESGARAITSGHGRNSADSGNGLGAAEFRPDADKYAGLASNVVLAPGTLAYGFGGQPGFFPRNTNPNTPPSSGGGSGRGPGSNNNPPPAHKQNNNPNSGDNGDNGNNNPPPTADVEAPRFLGFTTNEGAVTSVGQLQYIEFSFSDNQNIDEAAIARSIFVRRNDADYVGYTTSASVTDKVRVTITGNSILQQIFIFSVTPIDAAGNRAAAQFITITDRANPAPAHNTFQDVTVGAFGAADGFIFGQAAAFVDFDKDGREDLYIANPFRTGLGDLGLAITPSPNNRLFHQNSNQTFTDLGGARNALMSAAGDTDPGSARPRGVVFGDINNDSLRDFFIPNDGGFNVLKRAINSSEGPTFVDDSSDLINSADNDGGGSQAAVMADFNGDSYLDIFVANGLDGNILYLNRRPQDNSFENVIGQTGLAASAGNCSGAVAFDVDQDTDSDLLLLYRNAASKLYINQGPNGNGIPQFSLAAGVLTHATDSNPAGVEVGDLDNDGDLDVFITDLTAGRSALYRNDTPAQGAAQFANVTSAAGLTAILPTASAVGAAFLDFDNDGDLDIYVSYQNRANVLLANPYNKANTDFALGDAAFTNATGAEFVAAPQLSEHASTGDYNNDGRTDIFVAAAQNNSEQSVLYKNISENSNHFLKIKLAGAVLAGQTQPRDTTGATVQVLATGPAGALIQTQQLLGGNGRSQDSSTLLFGLGNLDPAVPHQESTAHNPNIQISIMVRWPNTNRITEMNNISGHVLFNASVSADRTVVVSENLSSPFFVNDFNNRSAALDSEFVFMLQVDDAETLPNNLDDLVVTVIQNAQTPANYSIARYQDTLDKWLFRFTPRTADGAQMGRTYDVTFRLTGSGGRAFEDSLHIQVVSQEIANDVPIILSGDQSVVFSISGNGPVLSIPIDVLDPDNIVPTTGPALEIRLLANHGESTNPPQLTGNTPVEFSTGGKTLTRTIEWTPDAVDIGPHTLTVAVDDFIAGDPDTPVQYLISVEIVA